MNKQLPVEKRLNAQLLEQVLGESLESLDMLVLVGGADQQSESEEPNTQGPPGENSADWVRQLLRQAYPSHSGQPQIYAFTEVADYSLLEKRRWPVACLLSPMSAGLSKLELTRLLARLRDLHADKIVHTESGYIDTLSGGKPGWSIADGLALGFLQRALPIDDETDLQVYEFDIHTYKPAPDWLNAKHWANPEMWEKHRW